MNKLTKSVVGRVVDVFGRIVLWVHAYILSVLGRAPFSILLTVLGSVVFVLPQTREFALIFASHDTPWSQLISFFVALTIWSLSAWYCALLNLRRIMGTNPRTRRREIVDENREPFITIRLWLPRALGLLPLLVVASVFISNSAIYGRSTDRNLAIATVVLGAAIFAFMKWRRRIKWIAKQYSTSKRLQFTELPEGSKRTLGAGFALSTVMFVALLMSPVGFSVFLGAPALVCFAISSWIMFGDILLVHAPKARGWPSLAIVPVIFFVVCSWFNDNHAVRSTARSDTPFVRQDLSEQVDRWLAERKRDGEIKGKNLYYMYVVAAAGGGIRAAYWTASVLGKLQDDNPKFANRVFAISGVSGGSLGAATFVALLADNRDGRRLRCAKPNSNSMFQDCADAVLKGDFASPVIGYMLYPDLVQRFFLPGISYLDRARAMELSWESAWKKAVGTDRFKERTDMLWNGAADTKLPSLLLNSTRVETGKRVIASNLRITGADTTALQAEVKGRDASGGDFPDAYDLFDARLDTRGMALSTAVHNSARFTLVSPLGTVNACRDAKGLVDCRTPGAKRETWGRIVDGGYFENSGAETARDLTAVLKDKIGEFNARGGHEVRLVVILITNDPEETIPGAPIDEEKAGSPFLTEVFGPINTLFRTRDARGSFAQAETDVDAKKRSEGEIYMEVVYFRLKHDKPNETAAEKKRRLHKPPLGWYLASESIEVMRDILLEEEGLATIAVQLASADAP
jgi:hypothetical protein